MPLGARRRIPGDYAVTAPGDLVPAKRTAVSLSGATTSEGNVR
jgi:hypothetical protein